MIKKYFFTGLAILLPAVLTFIIIAFIINLLTKPFLGPVVSIFDQHDLFNEPFLFFSGTTVLLIASKIIILFALIAIIIGVGVLGELFLIRWLRHAGDFLLHRIPFLNKIYKPVQDIVHTIFVRKSEKTSFSKVVLVPFPHRETLSIGMITNSGDMEGADLEYRDQISVFVPGTPNPAMGFMLMFRKEQLIYTDIKVDEAFKFCVSCGVIAPAWMIEKKELPNDTAAK